MAGSRMASFALAAAFTACSGGAHPVDASAENVEVATPEVTTATTSPPSTTTSSPRTAAEPPSGVEPASTPSTTVAAPTTATTTTTATAAPSSTGTLEVIWQPAGPDEVLRLDLTHEATGSGFATGIQATEVIPDLPAGRWFIEAWGSREIPQPDGTTLSGDAVVRYVLDLEAGVVTGITCSWDWCEGERLSNRDHPEP